MIFLKKYWIWILIAVILVGSSAAFLLLKNRSKKDENSGSKNGSNAVTTSNSAGQYLLANSTEPIKYGSTGYVVSNLQDYLNHYFYLSGLTNSFIKVDGIWGSDTAQAVKRLNANEGVAEDFYIARGVDNQTIAEFQNMPVAALHYKLNGLNDENWFFLRDDKKYYPYG
jgi:hypothetical protein